LWLLFIIGKAYKEAKGRSIWAEYRRHQKYQMQSFYCFLPIESECVTLLVSIGDSACQIHPVRKLTWALVLRVFIETPLYRIDWMIAHVAELRLLVDWYVAWPKVLTLKHCFSLANLRPSGKQISISGGQGQMLHIFWDEVEFFTCIHTV